MKRIIRLRLGTASEYNEINQQRVFADGDVGANIHQKMLWFLIKVVVRIEISCVYFDKFIYKSSSHDKQISRQSQTSTTRRVFTGKKIIIRQALLKGIDLIIVLMP